MFTLSYARGRPLQKDIINGAPIPRVTMATEAKISFSYVTSLELEILIRAHGENEHMLSKGSIAAATDKERQWAWKAITARGNT